MDSQSPPRPAPPRTEQRAFDTNKLQAALRGQPHRCRSQPERGGPGAVLRPTMYDRERTMKSVASCWFSAASKGSSSGAAASVSGTASSSGGASGAVPAPCLSTRGRKQGIKKSGGPAQAGTLVDKQ